MPRSHGDERQRRRLFPTQLRGLWNNVHAGNGHELRATTVAAITNDVVLAAKIVATAETGFAVATRNAGLDHHFRARLDPRHQFAHLGPVVESGQLCSRTFERDDEARQRLC